MRTGILAKTIVAASLVMTPAVIGSAALASDQNAISADAILQRLDALEKANGALQKENGILRNRVEKLEAHKGESAGKTAAIAPARSVIAIATSGPSAPSTAPPASHSVLYDRAAPTAVGFGWSGFYAGGQIGGALIASRWNNSNGCTVFLCPPADLGSDTGVGILGGGHVGYNFQSGYLIYGIEGQFNLADLYGSHQTSYGTGIDFGEGPNAFAALQESATDQLATRVQDVATVAGRIGVATDQTLFYATGGLAYARMKFTDGTGLNGSVCNFTAGVETSCSAVFGTGMLNAEANRWGWMVGAGVEYALFGNWSARLQYEYLNFGTRTATLTGNSCGITSSALPPMGTTSCAPSSSVYKSTDDIHLVQLGVTYHFTH